MHFQVIEGMEVLMEIGGTKTDNGDRPHEKVIIQESGILPISSPFEVSDDPNE